MIRVTFNQVFCKDDTSGFGADEIYFLAVPRLLREKDGHPEMRDLPGVLSEVREKVKTKSRYQPKLLSGKSSFEFDLEDAKSALIALYLYELDDGAHYKSLRESPILSNAPIAKTAWGKIADYIPKDTKDWFAWLKSGYKLVSRAVSAIAKDDLIGKYPITISPQDDATFGFRQFRFKGNGGEYDLTLHVERI
jgi:hypothetical protein